MKKLLSAMLAITLIFSLLAIPVNALEAEKVIPLEEEIVEVTLSMETAIEDYLSAREISVQDNSANGKTRTVTVSDERTDHMIDYWQDFGVNIVASTVNSSIISAQKATRSNAVDMMVYEWTWLDYNDGETDIATDRMGFATIHDLTITPNGNNFVVIRDSYDESDITGYTSSDYDEVEFSAKAEKISTQDLYAKMISTYDDTNSSVVMDNTEDITYFNDFETGNEMIVEPRAASSLTNGDGIPNVWKAIDHANTYVHKDISSSSGTANSAYYHPDYGHFGSSSSDCCNFVSQCLYAGGFVMDRTSSTTWYHDRNGNGMSSSSSWRYIPDFLKYWQARYGAAVSIGTSSNKYSSVFPGNPVFTSGEKHVAICVGYNSSGIPIINGHTRDVYHQTIANNGYSTTIQINTSASMMTNKPANANYIEGNTWSVANINIPAGSAVWYKYTPTTTGYRTVYTSGSQDTIGYLMQDQGPASSNGTGSLGIMYMYQLAQDDDSGSGTNFSIRHYFEKGKTYYILVRYFSPTVSGRHNFIIAN